MLGVNFTQELSFKMKKVKSDKCLGLGCEANTNEDLEHFLFHCTLYQNICEEYLPQFILCNPNISSIFDDEQQAILLILDPVLILFRYAQETRKCLH